MDWPSVDRTGPGNNAVGGGIGLIHPEVRCPVLGEHSGFLERVFVDKLGDALAGGHLAAVVLLVQACLPAAESDAVSFFFQLFEALRHAGIVRLLTHLFAPFLLSFAVINWFMRVPRRKCGCGRRW